MRVFVTGGSGVLGRALLPRLVARGHAVDALTLTDRDAAVVAGFGATPVSGDLLDAGSIGRIAADAVVHMATSIPRPDSPTGSWERNDRIRTEGTRHLVELARHSDVGRIIGYSVIWVYGDHGDDWITEDTPLPALARPEIRSALVLEECVRTSGLDWVIVRGGHLYGAGTGTTEQLLDAAAAGVLRTDGAGSQFDSMVHPVDTAQGIVLALERVEAASVLNVVDDAPMRQRDIYRAFAARADGPTPLEGPPTTGWGSLRVSNSLARSYGLRPEYPDVSAGLRATSWHPATTGVRPT